MTTAAPPDTIDLLRPPSPNREWSRARRLLWRLAVGMAIAATFLFALVLNQVSELSGTPVTDTRLILNRTQGDLALYAAKKGGQYPRTADELREARPYYPGSVPPTDAWGHPVFYMLTPKGPVLISLGADGKLGGKGDDADRFDPPSRGGRSDYQVLAL
jgi:hypothetical protein